ncbi:MAG: metallophosphoesterase family protein [Candidatus Lokiarchaeota archaeon]|nr:metallophosphoesterase family protein [Candidatus Lokiarchaeota archaeon]
MVKFGVLSDTFISDSDEVKTRDLLIQIAKIFKGVDYVLHLGNVYASGFLDGLNQMAPVRCVRGELDDIKHLVDFISFSVGPYKIGMIHQPPNDLNEFIRKNQLRILIHGKTCVPLIESTSSNVLILNPGSPTHPKAPPQKKGFNKPIARPSVMIIEINDKNYMLSIFLINLEEKNS